MRPVVCGLCCALLLFLSSSCGSNIECIEGISQTSLNPSGSDCKVDCDCNNQRYEGRCVDKKCVSKERGRCSVKEEQRNCPLAQAVGQCTQGVQTCGAGLRDLYWGDCKSFSPAENETTAKLCADGLDNDCDGKTDLADEDCKDFCNPGKVEPCYTGDEKTRGIGLCRMGTRTCKDDRTWGSCAGEGKPQVEVCDGKDNDCDGAADEELPTCCVPGQTQSCYSGPPETRGIGLCQDGERTCKADRTWGVCGDETTPQPDICDGKDNDCDGSPDEGCPCTQGEKQSCGLSIGACKPGTQECDELGRWGSCTGLTRPQQEICDGIDNDCDGQIDNWLSSCCTPGATGSCYSGPDDTGTRGMCRVGKRTCKEDRSWGACQGEVKPTKELCDGKDNDCDGETDEDCPCKAGETQECGESDGACKRGKQTCDSAGKWGECVGEVKPAKELCDGLDNNCNGQIDENIPEENLPLCEKQEGICKDIKKTQDLCQGGKWLPCTDAVYKAARNRYQSKERCNGRDNDCNGKTDDNIPEENTPACEKQEGLCKGSKKVQALCQDGKWTACTDAEYTAHSKDYGTTDTKCDGVDEDCDGIIDDEAKGCVATITTHLTRPTGVTIAPNGTVYVSYSARISWIDPQGKAVLLAGAIASGDQGGPALDARFDRPRGIVAASNTTLYVADSNNHRIRKLEKVTKAKCGNKAEYTGWCVSNIAGTGSKGFLDGPADQAQFFDPFDLTVDSNGTLYVADSNNHRIRKLEQVTKAKCGSKTDYTGWCVSTIAGTGQNNLKDGPADQANLKLPRGIAIDSNGILYVADTNNRRMRKLEQVKNAPCDKETSYTGWCLTTLTSGGTTLEARFEGIAIDAKGDLYVSAGNNTTSDDRVIVKLALLRDGTCNGTSKFTGWCATTYAGKEKAATNQTTDGPLQDARFFEPRGVAIDDKGVLYVADEDSSGSLRRLTPP